MSPPREVLGAANMRDDDPAFFPARWLFPPEQDRILAGIALTVPEHPVGSLSVGPLALAGTIAGGGGGQHIEVRGHHVVVVGDGAAIPDPRRPLPDARPELRREAEWFGRHHRAWRAWRPAADPANSPYPFSSWPPSVTRVDVPVEPKRISRSGKPPGFPSPPAPAVIEPARRLVSPAEFARADRERDRLVDAAIAEAETMIERGERRRALLALRQSVRELPSARLFERITDLERALCRGPSGTIEWSGRKYVVHLRDVARIGRADADIEISAPWLSRNHVLVRRGTEGPELVDLGSTHGTWLDGTRVAGPLRIDAARELYLGRVRLVVEPWHECHVLLSGDDLPPTIVTCGPALSLGEARIVGVPDDAGSVWRLEAPLGRPAKLASVSCTAADLVRGDQLSLESGPLVVIA
ncbi:MAG: FHA domain-containing protein [Polyangiaceae bacterium]|nr:FHA domain-containing protein [Polyangiaceae bacterium]